jgi:NADH-quinone oxidoreductase subunit G
MLSAPRHAYILHGIEPDFDIGNGELADAALKSADVVVALTSFAGEALLDCADVVLPIAAFAETPGTFVNAEGRWQHFAAAATPYGESRPGWRVLRVLATTLGADDISFQNIEEVQAELKASIDPPPANNDYHGTPDLSESAGEADLDEIDLPMYSIDPLVRRSQPLQQTRAARERSDPDEMDRRSA